MSFSFWLMPMISKPGWRINLRPIKKACFTALFPSSCSTPVVGCCSSVGRRRNTTPAVCGPIPVADIRDGEPTEDAAHRRLGEEMGFDCALQEVTAFIYEAQVPGGLIEHEFDHVYIGRHDGEPVPNPAEASDWRWIEPHRLLSWMGAEPELFTVWFFKTILVSSGNQLEQWSQRAQLRKPQATKAERAFFQGEILARVSRTFALTIPQLPVELSPAVTNAYLILRLADTIEDEPALSLEQIRLYEGSLLAVVSGQMDARRLSDEVGALLSVQTLKAEHDLLEHLAWVMEANSQLSPLQRDAIVDCLAVMGKGMSEFRRDPSLKGLTTRHDLDRYCYCAAGVVGEMLTTFFIDYEPALGSQRALLSRLSVSLVLRCN